MILFARHRWKIVQFDYTSFTSSTLSVTIKHSLTLGVNRKVRSPKNSYAGTQTNFTFLIRPVVWNQMQVLKNINLGGRLRG